MNLNQNMITGNPLRDRKNGKNLTLPCSQEDGTHYIHALEINNN